MNGTERGTSSWKNWLAVSTKRTDRTTPRPIAFNASIPIKRTTVR